MRNPLFEANCGDLPETSTLEECLFHLEQLDEQRLDALVALEVNKHRIKVQYDKSVHPRKFSEGDLVLLWDQAREPLGAGKFNPMWHGPYVVKRVLEKGSYDLVDYEWMGTYFIFSQTTIKTPFIHSWRDLYKLFK